MSAKEIRRNAAKSAWEQHKTVCARCAVDNHETRLLGRLCLEGTQLFIDTIKTQEIYDSDIAARRAAMKKTKATPRRPKPGALLK
jgi:hypothetical protein